MGKRFPQNNIRTQSRAQTRWEKMLPQTKQSWIPSVPEKWVQTDPARCIRRVRQSTTNAQQQHRCQSQKTD